MPVVPNPSFRRLLEREWARDAGFPQLRAYCLAFAWVRERRHHPRATPAERALLERLVPPNDAQADGDAPR